MEELQIEVEEMEPKRKQPHLINRERAICGKPIWLPFHGGTKRGEEN